MLFEVVIGWNFTTMIGASSEGSLSGPLPHGSSVVVSVDLQHSGFLDFCLTVPVDVVKVKSYAKGLFQLARIEMGISIKKLYFVQERAVTSVVGEL